METTRAQGPEEMGQCLRISDLILRALPGGRGWPSCHGTSHAGAAWLLSPDWLKSLSGVAFTGCGGDALSKVLSTVKAASSEIMGTPELGGKSRWLPSVPLKKDGRE